MTSIERTAYPRFKRLISARELHLFLRSVQRYVKPGLAAVRAATETLSSPRRRG